VGRERRVDGGTAQQLVGHVERLVVFRVWRNVGLRTGLLLTFGPEVTAPRRFAAGVGARLHLIRNVLHYLAVRRNAPGLDRAAGRREVAGGGEPQRTVARAERNDRLHRAFAERARADHSCPLVILQRTGHDFRRRGRAAVHQHDDRLALGHVAGTGVEALGLLAVAAAGRDDLAALEEGVRDCDRLVEQTARVVAQIDHIALELVGRDLRGEIADRLLQSVVGLLVELRDADVAYVAFRPRAHRAHHDHLARDRDLDRL